MSNTELHDGTLVLHTHGVNHHFFHTVYPEVDVSITTINGAVIRIVFDLGHLNGKFKSALLHNTTWDKDIAVFIGPLNAIDIKKITLHHKAHLTKNGNEQRVYSTKQQSQPHGPLVSHISSHGQYHPPRQIKVSV